MTSFRVCRCVVCDTKVKCLPFSLNQNDDDSRANKNKLLWESFSSFFCLSQHIFTSADPDDPSKKITILPFCGECEQTVVKLSNLYQQLGLIQSQISTTIGYLSWTVIKTTTTTTNSTTTLDNDQNHHNDDNKQIIVDPQIKLHVKNEESTEIQHTKVDSDFPTDLNEESIINKDSNEDPEIANIVKHVRQLIYEQFSPQVKLRDSVKSLQRKQVLKRRRNLKKENERKRRAEQRKQRKQTSKEKPKATKPLPALIKIKTEQRPKSDVDDDYNDDDFEIITDNNTKEDNVVDELSSPLQNVHNTSSNLDETRDENHYDSFDEYFNDDTTDTTTTTTKKRVAKDEKNVNDKDNKRVRLKRKAARKNPTTKKQKRVKKEKKMIENQSECENESNSDLDEEEVVVVVGEDPDFNPDVERSEMKKERKMRPSERRLTSKKIKKKPKGPDYISFQQLILQIEEISPGQFMLGGKYPYEKTNDGDFTCKVGECIFSTKVEKEIHSHLYHMHNEQRFPCKDCQKSYETEKKQAHHVCRPQLKRRVMYKTVQREDGSFAYHDKWIFCKVGELFQCGTCNVFKAKLNSMGTHIREHHIEPDRYKCPHPNCDNSYGNRKSFLCHTALHLPDRDFLCEECSMSFRSASNLQRHKLVHSSKSFECNVCHKKYMYAEGLNRHRRESGHLSETVLAARLAITPVPADSPSELDLSITSASNSTTLQTTTDPQSTLATVTTSFIANLICPNCHTPHENAKKFNIHISFCGKPKKYLCDFCSKGFHVKSYLQRHILRYHGDGGSNSGPVEKQTRRKRSDYQDNNTPNNTTTPTSNYQFQQQNQQQPLQEQEQQALQLLRGQENVQIHVSEFLTNTAFFTQLPHERIFN